LFLNPHITWHRKSNPVTGRRSIGNGAEAQAIPAHPHLKNPLPAKIALAHWEEGVYVAGMTKELVFPNDLAACHAINRDQAERVARLQAEREAALQLAFHKKIERYLPDPEQFVLDLGDSPGVVDAAEGIADATLETVAGYERRKQATEKARSEQLPAHLPRYEVKLDVPEDQKTCA
jgi:hypothetical protein